MNRVSRDVESRVIALHFEGVPRDSIASKLGISPATVSEILSILPPVLEPLRTLSVELRKRNMVALDALAGVGILNDLRDLGIEPEQYFASLQAVMKLSADAQHSSEAVVQAGARLVELENEAGCEFPQAIRKFEKVIDETRQNNRRNKKLETRYLQLQSQIREKEEQRVQAFRAADEAPENISAFKKAKAKLLRYKLRFKDVEVILKLLENVEEAGGNVKMLVSRVKKVGSLKRELTKREKKTWEVKRELAHLETQKETVEREFHAKLNIDSKLEGYIRYRQNTLANLNYQIQMGCAQLRRLRGDYARYDSLRREAIGQIGRIFGMDDSEIITLQLKTTCDMFYQDLQKRLQAFLDRYQKELWGW